MFLVFILSFVGEEFWGSVHDLDGSQTLAASTKGEGDAVSNWKLLSDLGNIHFHFTWFYYLVQGNVYWLSRFCC